MTDYIVEVPTTPPHLGVPFTKPVEVKKANWVTYQNGHVFFSNSPLSQLSSQKHLDTDKLVAAFAPGGWLTVEEVKNGTTK